MIKFSGVGKTYVSKSKSKVEALKDVNFELGANGMTFILGKSGSGKSTLLNLLGGLDKPTVGSISVDGVDMQSFTQSDYESYRNGYVGFVFQEYNLLDDFNVKDNVALALQLSKDTDVNQKVIDALKQVELSEEYLTRRVGELSGGEKQRVAIARALIKDSKMILADEPTGNLDSETGESIWNILKTLSQTRPVIVVSHDRESADKYADRTIEISDGKIISDNGKDQEIQPTEEKKFTPTKQRLSFLMLLKMGFNNLTRRKVKTISVILVSAFTVCALLVSQLMSTFMPERSIAKYVKDYDQSYMTVEQGHLNPNDTFFGSHCLVPYSTKQYLQQNAQTLEWSYAENKQQLLDFGFEFIGDALELDERSFYLSQDKLEAIYQKSLDDVSLTNVVLIDGEEQLILRDVISPEELVGKQVRIKAEELKYDDYYILAGVIKSVDIDLPDIIALKQFEGREPGGSISLNYESGAQSQYVLEINGNTYDGEMSLTDNGSLGHFLSAENGVIDSFIDEEWTLAENEIVITHALYRRLLNGCLSQTDYVRWEQGKGYNVISVPSIIGQTVSIKLYDYKTGDIIVDLGERVIKGIEVNRSASSSNKIYFNPDVYAALNYNINKNGIIVKTDSVKNLNRFIVTLSNEYRAYVSDCGKIDCADGIPIYVALNLYSMEDIYRYGIISISICAVLAVVMVLLTINLISFSINNRKKEIGILSAIGASAWDIIKIFILETLIISLIIFALGIAGIFSLVAIFNVVFSNLIELVSTLSFFVVDIYALLTLFGVCFVLLPLFALIPTIRIAKLKPIDAIRNVT